MWTTRAAKVVAIAGLALVVWAVWDRAEPVAWMREARPLPYFAVMCLLIVVGAPITPFFVVAGATFGVAVGLIGSGVAFAGALAVSYWIARGRLRPLLMSLLGRYGREFPDFGEAGRSSLRFALMVKFAPGLPGALKNYVLAMAGVPFPVYFAVSFLVTGAYGAALIVLGESLLEHDLRRALPGLVVVGVVALALWWWRQRGRHGRRGGERSASRAPLTAR